MYYKKTLSNENEIMSTRNKNLKKMCQHVGVNTGSNNLPQNPPPIMVRTKISN